MHSSRITTTLTSASTTPRSGRRLLETLLHQDQVDANEHMYEEAKLLLGRLDVETAHAVFSRLPSDFRNVRRYLEQCETYRSLACRGVVHRACTAELRAFLWDVLGESADSLSVGTYAERLRACGYGATSLRAAGLSEARSLFSLVDMQAGHRRCIEAHLSRNTPPLERALRRVTRAAVECGVTPHCLVTTAGARASGGGKMSAKRKEKREASDDDEDSTGM